MSESNEASLGYVFDNEVKFKALKIGQLFECYGDTVMNYSYPKICKCIKDSENMASEIDGISFYISGNDSVFVGKHN
jgi:hypothetical protein